MGFLRKGLVSEKREGGVWCSPTDPNRVSKMLPEVGSPLVFASVAAGFLGFFAMSLAGGTETALSRRGCEWEERLRELSKPMSGFRASQGE